MSFSPARVIRFQLNAFELASWIKLEKHRMNLCLSHQRDYILHNILYVYIYKGFPKKNNTTDINVFLKIPARAPVISVVLNLLKITCMAAYLFFTWYQNVYLCWSWLFHWVPHLRYRIRFRRLRHFRYTHSFQQYMTSEPVMVSLVPIYEMRLSSIANSVYTASFEGNLH